MFRIVEAEISYITDFELHTFLGRPVWRCLLSSMLAPWQRLAAIKTFLYPTLNFATRVGAMEKEEWRHLDNTLWPFIKRTL